MRNPQPISGAPELVIIIPARNASLTIARCLDSIDALDGRVEVVVVDDGSDDGVLDVVVAASHPHVKTVSQLPGGVSVARNRGLAESTPEYVMFVDADDYLPKGSLADFLDAAMASRADVFVGDFYIERSGEFSAVSNVNSSRRVFGPGDATVLQWLCLGRVGFDGVKGVGLLGAPWAKIYRRSFLEAAFPNGEVFTPGVRRGQDVLSNVEIFGKATKVGYHPMPVYVYSVSELSSSHRAVQDFSVRAKDLIDRLYALVEREHWPHLSPAVAKVGVTLLDEGARRLGRSAPIAQLKTLAQSQPFADCVKRARLTDFSAPGRLKLFLLRARAYRAFKAVAVLSRSR